MLRSLLAATVLCSVTALASITEDSRLSTDSLPIYHRLISLAPGVAVPTWELRGLLHVDAVQDEAWLEETGKGVEHLNSPAWEQGTEGEERYQISVGEQGEGERRQVIAVDSCILYHHPTQPFTELLSLVYTSPPAKSQITGLRYSTSGAHPACAPGASREGLERGAGRLGGALEVKVDRGMKVEPIRLRPAGGGPALDPTKPVVVGADGKIVPPAPEKSFIQKYWIYIVPLLLVLMMGGGGEEGGAPAAK